MTRRFQLEALPTDQPIRHFVAEGFRSGLKLADDTQPTNDLDQLLALARDGKIASLTVEATVSNTNRNRNHFRFRPSEFEDFAASFEGQPFLKDHGRMLDDKAGNIIKSWASKDGDAYTMRQHLQATEQWAITGLLSKKINRFSIGWDSDALCSVCDEDMELFHKHTPGKSYDEKGNRTKDKSGAVCEAVMVAPVGMETSAVVIPACEGTGVIVGLSDGSSRIYSLGELFARPEVGRVEGDAMIEKIRKVFGLAADANEDVVLAAVTTLSERQAEQAATLARVTEKLKLPVGTEGDGILAAIMQLGSPANFVPIAEYKAALETIRTGNAKHRVELLMRDGVFSPAEQDYAIAQCLSNENDFEAWATTKPKSVPIGGSPPPRQAAQVVQALTADERKICQSFGLSEKDYIEQKEADRALLAGR